MRPFRNSLPLPRLTLYTNPFTIVPLYLLAYQIGRVVTGDSAGFIEPPAFEMTRFVEWTQAIQVWMLGVAKPLGIGLILLAITLAVAGYLVTKTAWRWWLIRAWRQRSWHQTAGNGHSGRPSRKFNAGSE